MWLDWLQEWTRPVLRADRNRRQRPRTRPQVERLEDRTLLSASRALAELAATDALRVVLINDSVPHAQEVAAAAEDAVAIVYDADTTDTAGLVGLLEDVSRRHGGAPVGHLGLVTHGEPGRVLVGAGDAWSVTTLDAHAADLERLRTVLTADARFDLYACDVAADADGKRFVDALAGATGATVYASDDPVGSGDRGDLQWEYATHVGSASDRELLAAEALEALPNFTLSPPENLGTVQGGPWFWDRALAPPNDLDTFFFTTTATATGSHYVQIEFNSSFGDMDLELWNSAGTVRLGISAQTGTSFERIFLSGLPAGTYQIVTYQRSFFFNLSYRLTINAPVPPAADLAEPNDSFATAWSLGLLAGNNAYTNLTVHAPFNDDWFRFDTVALATTSHFIRLEHDSSQGNLNLALLNSQGNVLFFYENFDNFKQIGLNGLPQGSYWIRVYGLGHTNPNYTLRINAPTPPPPDSREPNDTFFAASNLGTLTGANAFTGLTVHAPFNDDWYTFQTANTASGSDYVRIEHTSSQGNLNVALLDSAGYVLWYYENFDNVKQIPLGGLPAGRYYVRVYGIGFTNPNYTLRIQAPPPPPGDAYEPNDSRAGARDLGTVNGLRTIPNLSIHLPGNDDWFQFTLGPGAITGHFVRTDFYGFLGDIDLELYNSGGSLIGYSYGVGNREEISLAGLPGGTYYVRVFGFFGAVNPNYTLSINAPYTAIPPDFAEPNDTPTTPYNLGSVSGLRTWGPQTGQNLSIHQPGNFDWFQFSTSAAGTAGHFVQLDFDGRLGDVDMLLYNSAGVLVGQSQGIGDRERIALQGLPADTYRLVVYGFLGATNPSYTLTINAPGTTTTGDRYEPNNSRTAATDFGTVRGTRVENDPLSIHAAGDEDWFRFVTTQTGGIGHLAGITFQHLVGDLDLQLYDANGVLLASSAGVRDYETISLSGRPAGTYFIRVYGFNNTVNPEYRLFLNAPGGDAAESNNTYQTAYLLRDLQPLPNLSISPPDPQNPSDDVDWFRLDLATAATAGHFARIDFVHALGDLDLYLYASNGTTLLRSSLGVSDAEVIRLDGLAAGTYYLQVVGFNHATNPNYTLTVNAPLSPAGDWAEPNNSRTAAYNLGPVQGLRTWVDAQRPLSILAGDEDWFRFDTVAAGVAGHAAGIFFNHAEGDLDLELYDAGGNLLERSAGVGNFHTVSLAGRAAGTYYLRVVGFNGAANPRYALAIQAPQSATGDWAEPNNSRTAFRDLGMVNGPRLIGDLSVHQSGDADWFRFQIGAAGQNGHLVGIFFNQAYGDLDLRLYDNNGNLLETAAGVDSAELISLQGRPAGVYYLEVVGRPLGGDATATNPAYVLAILAPDSGTGDWAEDNDTRQAAFNLRTVNGFQVWGGLSVHASGDDDYFAFQLTGDATTGSFVAIRHDPTLGDLDLRLLDSGGNVLNTSATGEAVERISLAGLRARDSSGNPLTYFVQVSGFNGATNPAYQLAINAPNSYLPQPDWAEPNDSRTAARDLQRVQGLRAWSGLSIHTAGNEDWFRFETTGAGTEGQFAAIVFDSSQGSNDLELRLYRADGTEIAASATAGNREQVSLANLPAGVYYLRVAGSGSATNPAYQLVINAPQSASADWAEPNNTRTTASNLREITRPTVVSGLSIHSGDEDWFRFALIQPGVPGQIVRIDFDRSQGNLALELLDAAGQPIPRAATGTGNYREIALDGLAGAPTGTPYYVRITGVGGATNPNYTLTVTAAGTPTPDRFEPNDSRNTATDLRQILGAGSRSRLLGPRDTGRSLWLLQQEVPPDPLADFLAFPTGFGLLEAPLGFSGIPLFTNNSGFSTSTTDNLTNLNPLLASQFNQLTGLSPNALLPASSALINPFSSISGNNPFLNGANLFFGGNSNFGVTLPSLQGALTDTTSFLQSSPMVDFVVNSLGGLGGLGVSNTIAGLDAIGGVPGGIAGVPGLPTYIGLGQTAGQLTNNALTNWPGLNGIGLAGMQNNPIIGPSINAVNNFDANLNLGMVAGLLLWALLEDRDSAGLQPAAVLAGLSIHSASDSDWFRFELGADGVPGQYVRLRFDHDLGNLDLELYDSGGTSPLIRSTGQQDREEILLAGLPAGTYYVRVFGTANPSYELSFSITPPVAGTGGDWAEPNNTRLTARDLRQIEGPRLLTDLSISDSGDRDWFRFTTRAAGRDGQFVRLGFDHNQGDLELALYDGNGNLITRSEGATNVEEISFAGRPAATYHIEIYGYQGATNPHYTLTFNLPEFAPVTTVAPDRLEPNNTFNQATNVTLTDGMARLANLTIHPGDNDYFRFSTAADGTSAHSVSIQFERGAGDLRLDLYREPNRTTPERSAQLTAQQAGLVSLQISLQGLPAGTYFVKVSGDGGSSGTVANRYQLNIDAPTVPAGTLDDWTIMIYMTASNLAAFSARDINEMERAAALLPGTVNLAVLWDQSSAPGLPRYRTAGGNQSAWGGVGRAVIQPDLNMLPPELFPSIATTFDLMGDSERNTGDPNTLIEFINWVANPTNGVARARNYALILWDHGNGFRGFNTDDSDGLNGGAGSDRLTGPELAQALEATRSVAPLSLIGFDECLMAMTEIVDLLRPYAPVVAASQEIEEGTGYDYVTAFSVLARNPGSVTAAMLGSSIVQSYQQQYRNNSQGADTYAALSTAGLSALSAALQAFTAALPANAAAPEWTIVRAARDAATSFINSPDYRDLGQFMDAVAAGFAPNHPIALAAQAVRNALDNARIAKTADQRNVSGLSIYLPAPGSRLDSTYLTQYQNFLTASGWGTFLQRFVSLVPGGLRRVDWSEFNNTFAQAFNLRQLRGSGHVFTGLSLHNALDRDFFRFTVNAQPTANLSVSTTYPSTAGLRLSLYDANRNLLRTSASGTGQETVTFALAGLPPGETLFYVLVEPTGLSPVPVYTLTVNAPTGAGSFDWARGNDVQGKARDLGTISEEAVFSGLTVEGTTPDWFAFETPRNESPTWGVVHLRITGSQALTLELRDAQNNLLRSAAGTGELHLEYASGAGTSYRLQVVGAAGMPATSYQLIFEPPGSDLAAFPFADDFNRADSPALGLGWTERWGDFTVSGNRATAASARSLATLTGAVALNVRLQADIEVPAVAGSSGGLTARYSGPGNANWYWGGLVFSGGQFLAQIRRNVGGTETTLFSLAVASGTGRLRFDVVGNSLTLYFNNQLLGSVEDTAISQAGGLGLLGAGAGFDNSSAEVIVPLQAIITPTASGFTASFNRPINLNGLNLYDAQGAGLGPADVTVVGNTTGPVRGSLSINPAGTAIAFVRTGGLLPPDTYTVTLRSAADAFRDADGRLLDGNQDGFPGDNLATVFSVVPSTAVVVGVPEFARGPGQPVDVSAAGPGLPLRISDGNNVTAIDLTLLYDATLLSITGVQPGPGLPPGATTTLSMPSPGVAVVTFRSTAPLNAGPAEFALLTAAVPDTATYTAKNYLQVTGVQVNGAAARADDGMHVVAYFGDITGNGGYSAADAARTVRMVVGLDSGSAAYQLADPLILGDVTGNGVLNTADAVRILQEAVGIDRPEIPPRPAGAVITIPPGPDPLLNIPTDFAGRPGDTITVPVNLDASDGLESADLAISYDTSRLQLLADSDIQRGSLTGDFDLFLANRDDAAGTLRVGLGRSAGPITGRGSGSVIRITFRIKDGAPAGPAIINLRQSLEGTTTQLNEGGLDLNPDPSDQAGDGLDGLITVQSEPLPLTTVRSVVINDGAPQRSQVTSVTVTFSGVVSFTGDPAAAFTLVGPRGNIRLRAAVGLDASGTQTVVTLTFFGRGARTGRLPDGGYVLTIDGEQIVDGSGQAVDGDRDGMSGGDWVDTFFRLYGDSDGDGDVDEIDRAVFRSVRGTRRGDPGYLPFLDFDGDGRINKKDARQFRRRLGRSLD